VGQRNPSKEIQGEDVRKKDEKGEEGDEDEKRTLSQERRRRVALMAME
jgi:hypothetical protein